MKSIIILASLCGLLLGLDIGLLLGGSTETALAAKLTVPQCRADLRAKHGDNDVRKGKRHLNNMGWVISKRWNWAWNLRINRHEILQFVDYYEYNGHRVTLRMFCKDRDRNGWLASGEDWFG